MKQAVKILNASAYLMRFDPPAPANDAPKIAEVTPTSGSNFPHEIAPTQTCIPDQPAATIDLTELNAQFEARLETLLAEEKARTADAIERARLDWITKENDGIATQIGAAISRGFAELRDDIAHTLRPLIAEDIKSRTLDAFLDDILTYAAVNPVATMEIRGPAHIVERIRTVVKPFNISIVTHEGDDSDVHIDFGVMKIETRLSSALPEILNEGTVADERK